MQIAQLVVERAEKPVPLDLTRVLVVVVVVLRIPRPLGVKALQLSAVVGWRRVRRGVRRRWRVGAVVQEATPTQVANPSKAPLPAIPKIATLRRVFARASAGGKTDVPGGHKVAAHVRILDHRAS